MSRDDVGLIPADAVVLAVVVVAGCSGAVGIFGDEVVVLVPVAVAALIGAAVPTVLPSRWPVLARVAIALSLGSLAVAVAATAVTTAAGGMDRAIDGLVNGPARMLSSAVPAPATPDLVVVAPVIALAAAIVGVELLRTGRRPVVLVPVVLAVLAITALGGVVQPVAVAVVVLGVLTVVRRPQPSGEAGRPWSVRVVGPVVAVLLAVVAATIAPSTPGLADREPWSARSPDTPVTTRGLSPLTATVGALTLEEQDLFAIRIDAPARVRTMSLDVFDGTAWRDGQTYVPSGRTLSAPGEAPLRTGGTAVTATITPTGLRGPFLPVVGQATTVDRDDIRVEPSSAELVLADGGVQDVDNYRVSGVLPAATNEVVNAVRARDRELGDTSRWTALPPIPADVRALAASIVEGQEGDVAMLAALRAHFLSGEYVLIDPRAFDASQGQQLPAGHSIARLRDFLGLRDEGGQPRVGTVEQFASAFTVMARSLGFPARVAVGYREASDDTVVTTARSHAWPEVALVDQGWTIWDPTPVTAEEPTLASEQDLDVPEGVTAAPLAPEDLPTDIAVLADPGASPFRVVSTVLGLVLLLAALGAGAVRSRARWLARQQVARATMAERTRLRWVSTVAALQRAGLDVDDTCTGTEVLDRVRATTWAQPFAGDVANLASAMTWATFSDLEPIEAWRDRVDAAHERVRTGLRDASPGSRWRPRSAYLHRQRADNLLR